MATLRPVGDRVVVKALKPRDVTAGGIVLPETAQEKPQEGRVIAVGSGRLLENGQRLPISVQPGQRILFAKYAGQEVQVGNEEFIIVREDDILAILEEEEAAQKEAAA